MGVVRSGQIFARMNQPLRSPGATQEQRGTVVLKVKRLEPKVQRGRLTR